MVAPAALSVSLGLLLRQQLDVVVLKRRTHNILGISQIRPKTGWRGV